MEHTDSSQIDYREISMPLWEHMSAEEFIAMASDVRFIGDSALQTQHFIGQSKWEVESDDKIVSHQQMRVAHQRYTDDSCKVVSVKGHAHGTSTVWYQKVAGQWKFAGLMPVLRWTEYDYEQLFGGCTTPR